MRSGRVFFGLPYQHSILYIRTRHIIYKVNLMRFPSVGEVDRPTLKRPISSASPFGLLCKHEICFYLRDFRCPTAVVQLPHSCGATASQLWCNCPTIVVQLPHSCGATEKSLGKTKRRGKKQFPLLRFRWCQPKQPSKLISILPLPFIDRIIHGYGWRSPFPDNIIN